MIDKKLLTQSLKSDEIGLERVPLTVGRIGVTSLDQSIIDAVGYSLLGIDYGHADCPDPNWRDYYASLNS